jgi:hypothetical protein
MAQKVVVKDNMSFDIMRLPLKQKRQNKTPRAIGCTEVQIMYNSTNNKIFSSTENLGHNTR